MFIFHLLTWFNYFSPGFYHLGQGPEGDRGLLRGNPKNSILLRRGKVTVEVKVKVYVNCFAG